MLGDDRWAGTYGVSADYIALTHCSVEYIALEDILVSSVFQFLAHLFNLKAIPRFVVLVLVSQSAFGLQKIHVLSHFPYSFSGNLSAGSGEV